MTNVNSTLTDSGCGHRSGVYIWSVSATDFSGIDLMGGGQGAQMIPTHISFGLDKPMRGADPEGLAMWLGLGDGIRGGDFGCSLDTATIGVQTFARASWRDFLDWDVNAAAAPDEVLPQPIDVMHLPQMQPVLAQ